MKCLTYSPQQQAIAAHGDGPALVLAVAGSGKTRVVCARAVRLADSPTHPTVLLVTFSRAGVAAMRDRLSAAPNLTITTAHALAYNLLGRPIVNEPRFRQLVDRARRNLRIPRDLDDLIDEIRLIKSRWPLEVPADQALLYEYVADLCARENVTTFDDLLQRVVAEKIHKAFDYVIQDEAQDLNQVQEAFITSCVGGANYMAVGDPYQCVYGFRGADPSLISEAVFKRRWPGAVTFGLATNYRSKSAIVAAADAISEPRSVSVHEGGDVVRLAGPTVVKEAHRIAEVSVLYSPTTILFRRHAQAGVLEAALRLAHVPFYNTTRWTSTVPMISYLWLAAGRGTQADVRRSINHPFRFVKTEVADLIWRTDHVTWQGRLDMLDLHIPALVQWAKLLDDLVLLHENGTGPLALVRTIVQRVGIGDRGLADAACCYSVLDDMLDDLDLPYDPSGVRLSTIHDAKGLEWDNVIVAGYEEDPKEVEGRRLNYVAFTRARDRLWISKVEMP